MPSDIPDPDSWLGSLESGGVTVWNTVPRLMELLVTRCERSGRRLPASLRVVYMSGDFIPPGLPGRIRRVSGRSDADGGIDLVSMGGATEAAVWSNIYRIPESGVEAGWTSIPYGRPMRNQTMYILDENLQHCAEWVTGRIFIGGAGAGLPR